MNSLRKLRATGRTTRMLEDAINTALQTQSTVEIIAADFASIRRLTQMTIDILKKLNISHYLKCYDTIAFGSNLGIMIFIQSKDITKDAWMDFFHTGKIISAIRRDLIVFIDHWVLEKEFPGIEMLHKYDLDNCLLRTPISGISDAIRGWFFLCQTQQISLS